MLLSKKSAGGVPYARKEPYAYNNTNFPADIQMNDVVKILDSGEQEQSQFGEQTVFKIKTRNGDKKQSFNQSTINVLVEEFGEDTEKWIGKEVKILLQKKVIAGKKCIVPYFVTDGWTLDEYGEVVKSGAPNEPNDIASIPF